MIRFAIPPIGGEGWFGGWMYMCNMVRALAEHGDREIETLLFLGPDRADDQYVRDLYGLPRTRIVVDPAFAAGRIRSGIGRTLATGRNAPILDAFSRERVDVAFAPAIYLGWRSALSSIAWFPDFQHRRLPNMFAPKAWFRREIGFRAQVASSRIIMLSSNDAAGDCERFYPTSQGRTRVARFAIPMDDWPGADEAHNILAAAGLPSDFVFLPNQLWRHKNHMLAIDAAAVLKRRGENRVILVTGRGEDPRRPAYPAELAAAIAARGVGDGIRFLGSVEHRLVQALMVRANALLNPSHFEGWSTTVEEAKGCGTPLLLSDIPVHREQAPDATFFGVGDAEALADAIAAAPLRLDAEIVAALAAARDPTLERRRTYAQAVSQAVTDARATG